jgi:hypothetical protein
VGCAVELFGLHPGILAEPLAVAFGVGDDGGCQFQGVFFGRDLLEGIALHRLGKVDGVQHLYLIATAPQELAALYQNGAFQSDLSRQYFGYCTEKSILTVYFA